MEVRCIETTRPLGQKPPMYSQLGNFLSTGLFVPRNEAVRCGLGAGLGIALCGLLARSLVEGHISFTPLLAAPIGASAVLVFALPASPLAQPRAVIGGNMLAAAVGVASGLIIPDPLLAAAVSVGAAIFAMSVLGCLHPPGGAMALGSALAASTATPLGFGYPFVPVGLCSVLLVLAASAYGRATGHAYPHRANLADRPHRTSDSPPSERFGYTRTDLNDALAQYGKLLDVSREDLDALFRRVEVRAHRRLHTAIPCADIMSRDVISLFAGEPADSALAKLHAHDLRTAPVVDIRGRVLGTARRAELFAGGKQPVGSVTDPAVHTVGLNTSIQALLPVLSSGAVHEAMVIDDDRILVGMVTQTDLLAMLYRAHVVEAVVATAAA